MGWVDPWVEIFPLVVGWVGLDRVTKNGPIDNSRWFPMHRQMTEHAESFSIRGAAQSANCVNCRWSNDNVAETSTPGRRASPSLDRYQIISTIIILYPR